MFFKYPKMYVISEILHFILAENECEGGFVWLTYKLISIFIYKHLRLGPRTAQASEPQPPCLPHSPIQTVHICYKSHKLHFFSTYTNSHGSEWGQWGNS